MARGAPLATLDDETSLNGPDVDVAVRIGWTTRMARLAPDGERLTLDAMSRRIGTSPATLHRLETGRLRDGTLLDAYEEVLRRPPGSLRAPIDVACRTFPSAPVDRDAGGRVDGVRDLSALTERVGDDRVSGGAWLAWARALSRPGAIGMPEAVALPLLARLVGELSRSVDHAHPSRYEALALLRGSDYGYLVVEVARAWVADPDVQVLYDLCSAVSEAVTPDAVTWCLALLDDPRERVAVGGALGLENMAQIGADAHFWDDLVDPLATRFNESEPDSLRWDWLSHLLRLMPHRVRTAGTVRLRHRFAPGAGIENWSRTRLNGHWTDCQERAHAVTATLGTHDQPVLSRLLFDIAISHFESRAAASNLLLGALPHLAGPVADHIADLAEHQPDAVLRARAGRRLPGALHGRYPPLVERWLGGADAGLRDRACFVAGAAGVRLPDGTLRATLADAGASARAGLYAAGMAVDPRLDGLAAGRRYGAEVRNAARWWLRTGTRVVDADPPAS